MTPRDTRIGIQGGWIKLRRIKLSWPDGLTPFQQRRREAAVRMALSYLPRRSRRGKTVEQLAKTKKVNYQAIQQILRLGTDVMWEQGILEVVAAPPKKRGRQPKAYETLRAVAARAG